jgi:uncharacterized membrane protein YfcA
MLCPKYCTVAVIFLVAMIYLSFSVDRCVASQNFMNTLNENQIMVYKSIISERRGIYFTGYLLGILLSCAVIFVFIGSKSFETFETICIIASITMLTSYFYYILSPKQNLMVLYLDNRRQREEWAKVYKTMQFNYHIGLLLGILAAIMFAKSCKEGDQSLFSIFNKNKEIKDTKEI